MANNLYIELTLISFQVLAEIMCMCVVYTLNTLQTCYSAAIRQGVIAKRM